MSATAAGARSSMTASASPNSSSDETRTPVSIAPPCSRRTEASASVIERDPPAATAQPNLWHAQTSAIPTEELIGRVSGLKACAATPPNSARACGVRQARARSVAGAAAGIPNRVNRSGWSGHRRTGRKMSSASSPSPAEGRPKTRFQALPSGPSPSAVALIARSITPAVPSSSGCARSTSGQRHSRPWRSSPSEFRNGEPTAIGCTAEQWSCSSPGTVSSLVFVPPPIASSASSTVTRTPSSASVTALARPLGPEPTTTAVVKRGPARDRRAARGAR